MQNALGGERVRTAAIKFLFTLLLSTFLHPLVSQAQVLYGSLTGTVTDPAGALVSGAKVAALNTDTGINKEMMTDEHGGYLFTDLQPGTYKVTITAASFGAFVQQGLRIDANGEQRADVQLRLANVNQSVTVDATVVGLQTDRADVNAQLQSSQITQLPEPATRNFQSIFIIIPGYSPPASSHSEAGNPQGALATDVNGASYNNNATRIDGALDLYPWLPEIVAYVPSTEAIQTVSAVTASFDAEQGMAGGSAVNISIKSGTNAFHGAAWEFNQISALKARNYFYYGANNPKNIVNQFGGNLGGPIIKNKLFFFGNWEITDKRANVSALETVPTDALRAGNFGATGANVYDPMTPCLRGT